MLLEYSCSSNSIKSLDSGINPAPAELVQIERLSLPEIKKLSQNGINPYIPRKNIILKQDHTFYVYRLSFLPTDDIDVRLVSASCMDEFGATIASDVLQKTDLQEYWSRYIMPEGDQVLLQSILDSTYLGRTAFKYSSKRGKEYVVVFLSKGPEISNVNAKFSFKIDDEAVFIEVK